MTARPAWTHSTQVQVGQGAAMVRKKRVWRLVTVERMMITAMVHTQVGYQWLRRKMTRK